MAEAPDLDAVIVSTPPDAHERLGLLCLRAGRPVLCEKPLAPSVEACERLVQAAEEHGVSLATGFNLRFTRAARLARRLHDQGAIGVLDHIRAFHGHSGGPEFGHDWVLDRSVTGGGTLMDNGIHLIDLTRWFLGGVESSRGFATNHTWVREGCEDNGFLLLRSPAGRVASLHSSWTEWRGYGYRVEIYGTQGFIRFGYPPLHLVHGRRTAGPRPRLRRYFFPTYQVLERVLGWEWGLVDTLVAELREWGAAVAAGTAPPVTGRDGLEAVRIALSAERA